METTRAGVAIYKINYQSDFILTVVCDVEWGTPFCIKFWTGEPSQAYYVGWTGHEYKNCKVVESDPSKLLVLFDDHHLPVGELKMQIVYHTTIEDFPNAIVDEVTNSMKVMAYIDGKNQKVALDFEGEEAAELQFELPAYANEAQRIANEEQRIANEQARIEAEQQRINNEQTRQDNEAQRIAQETVRVNEYAGLKADAVAATNAANDAATLANQKAQLAADKAALADAAATLANQKAQLAADKAALADAAATLANQKAEYADAQGDYAKEQGDYAKEQGDTALADHQRAESDHETAASDHTIAANDHTQAGNDHTRAESDHSTAADDHTLAASDHSTAADDHTLAASDHSTASDDHTLAASDHSTAADDHTQAGNDHTRAESDHTRAESDHAAVEVYVDSLGAFDISSYHATGGVLAKYADLTAALGTGGANIPEAIRKGGMSVKFVHTSDNKYVQYRYMGTAVTGTPNPFLDTANWQGVDDVPTAGSENLVKSGGVKSNFDIIDQSKEVLDSRFVSNDISTTLLGSLKLKEDGTIEDGTYYDRIWTSRFKTNIGVYYKFEINNQSNNDIPLLLTMFLNTPASGSTKIAECDVKSYIAKANSTTEIIYKCYFDGYVALGGFAINASAYNNTLTVSHSVFSVIESYGSYSTIELEPIVVYKSKTITQEGVLNSPSGQNSLKVSIFKVDDLVGHRLVLYNRFGNGSNRRYFWSTSSDSEFSDTANIQKISYGHSTNGSITSYYCDTVSIDSGDNYLAVFHVDSESCSCHLVIDSGILSHENYERIKQITTICENHENRLAVLENKVSDISSLLNSGYDADIIYWGDSMTAGGQDPTGRDVNIASVVQQELGGTYIKAAIGGERTQDIAFRQGGNTLSIPAGNINGEYEYSEILDVFGAQLSTLVNQTDWGNSCNPLTLDNGYTCNITNDTVNSKFVINGYEGPVTSVPLMARSKGSLYNGRIVVLWVGNNGTNISTNINDRPFDGSVRANFDARSAYIDSMVDHIGHTHFIIIGGSILDGQGDFWDENAKWLTKYGNKFINARQLICEYGMELCGLTPTAEEEAQIANHDIPARLRQDSIHFTKYGYEALGKIIAKRMVALGYDKLIPENEQE